MPNPTPQTPQPSDSDLVVPLHGPDLPDLVVTIPGSLIWAVASYNIGDGLLAESIVAKLADVILAATGHVDLSGMAPPDAGPEECLDVGCWDHLRRHYHDPSNISRTSPWSRTGTAVEYVDPEPICKCGNPDDTGKLHRNNGRPCLPLDRVD